MKKVSNLSAPGQAVAAELIGRRFGRLLVLGVLDDPNRSKKPGAAWVVRCVCGRFETRSRKALVNRTDETNEDRCSACWSFKTIKEAYQTFGAKPIKTGFRA